MNNDVRDRITNPENYLGGKLWNPFWRNTIAVEGMQRPLKDFGNFELHIALDHVTACVESGCLHRNRWPEQLFVDRPMFDKFIQFLSGYDDCFRITDRWWTALAELASHVDEEGFIRTEDMAEKLMEAFEEANSKHAQWAAKKKTTSTPAKTAAPAKNQSKSKR